jgi:phospholipid transport system substrate-binding protein
MHFTTTAVLRLLAAGFIALCAALPSAAQNTGAVAVVDHLHGALLGIMRDAKVLGFAGRREQIAPVIEESFDLPFITRFSLGRYWTDLSVEQQKAIVAVFSRWTIANYASRFNQYSGEQFETVSSEPAPRGRELVRTVLKVNSDPADTVRLDYLLQEEKGMWRIINVIANGVSDLSLKRADYGAVLKARGLDSLIEKLNAQIGDFQAKS